MIPLVDSISGTPGHVHSMKVAVDSCIDNAGQHTIAAGFISSPSQSGKEVVIIICSHNNHPCKYLY